MNSALTAQIAASHIQDLHREAQSERARHRHEAARLFKLSRKNGRKAQPPTARPSGPVPARIPRTA
jgi:hypothetical protein